MSSSTPKLYIVPTPIVESKYAYATSVVRELTPVLNACEIFIVEHVANALAFCKQQSLDFDASTKVWLTMHKQEAKIIAQLDQYYHENKSLVLMSDAGCPCIADPGYLIVAEAHRLGFEVMPFVGTSAILLALMSAGLPTQLFAFNGYLPIDKAARKTQLLALEKQSQRSNYIQIFIETPYRNQQLLDALLSTLSPHTQLNVSTALLSTAQRIRTAYVDEWRASNYLIPKENTIFMFYAGI